MPFKSEAQRRYLWANEPEIARDWTDTYGSRIHAANGGIMRLGFDNGGEVVVDENDLTYEESPYSNKYTEDEFNEVFGEETIGIGERITSGIDTLRDKFTGGVDYMKRLPGMAMGALSGIPGADFLINALSRPQYPSDPMSKSFAYGAPNMGQDYGYYGNLRHGNLTGQDQFGINTISLMGNYPAYYDKYVQDYENPNSKISKTSQFAQRKYEHAQAVNRANQERIARDFTVTAEDDYGAGNYIAPTSVPVPAHIRQRQGGNQGNKGGAATQAAGDLAGGRDTWGSSPFQRGGIAGLWPR